MRDNLLSLKSTRLQTREAKVREPPRSKRSESAGSMLPVRCTQHERQASSTHCYAAFATRADALWARCFRLRRRLAAKQVKFETFLPGEPTAEGAARFLVSLAVDPRGGL